MYLIAVIQIQIGNIRFLTKEKEIVNNLNEKDCIFETFSEANSVAKSKQHTISEDKKENENYDLRVIPLSLILLQLSQSKIKQLVFSLESEQIIKGQ